MFNPPTLVAAATTIIIAQQATDFSGLAGWKEMLVQGGALGILGVAVWWYMAKTIPAMQRDQAKTAEANRKERELMASNHDERIESLLTAQVEERRILWERFDRTEAARSEDSKKLTEALNRMVSHCQQATGVMSERAKKSWPESSV